MPSLPTPLSIALVFGFATSAFGEQVCVDFRVQTEFLTRDITIQSGSQTLPQGMILDGYDRGARSLIVLDPVTGRNSTLPLSADLHISSTRHFQQFNPVAQVAPSMVRSNFFGSTQFTIPVSQVTFGHGFLSNGDPQACETYYDSYPTGQIFEPDDVTVRDGTLVIFGQVVSYWRETLGGGGGFSDIMNKGG